MDARDLPRAVQQQHHAFEFALHHFEIEQGDLPHQSGADADLREHLSGEEEFALGFGPGFFPGELHRAVGRQVAFELAAEAFRPRGARKLELGIRGQALQRHGMQRARGEPKIQSIPAIRLPNRGTELELHGEFARVLEYEDKAIVFGAHPPLGMRPNFRERQAAGKQFERAALGIFNVRSRCEGEGRVAIGEVAGELEILERDGRGCLAGREPRGAESGSAKSDEKSFHFGLWWFCRAVGKCSVEALISALLRRQRLSCKARG